MKPDEYQRYDALGLAGLIRAGEVTAEEVCAAAVASIDVQNAAINAVVETCYDHAMAGVDELPEGPLKGVPWLLKDFNTLVKGLHDTNGSRSLGHRTAVADSELVARHRRAGLVILGKTNTPEFGMNVCTHPTLFGPTRHPLDKTVSVGGSSGGSAAAVAAGMVPAAHATDSGGSIRIPASNCGLFGLKPSRSLVPLGNDATEGLAGLSTAHALSHSVRDSALLLDICHGPLIGDALAARPPGTGFLDAMEAATGPLEIGLLTTGIAGESVHAACIRAVEQAGSRLEELGHRVKPVDSPVDGALLRATLDVVFAVNVAWVVSQVTGDQGYDGLERTTIAAAERAKSLSGIDYVQAQHQMRQISAQLARFFQSHDLLLTPTLAHPARPIGYHTSDEKDWDVFLNRMLDDIPFTPLFNVSGGPAVSIPTSHCSRGIPIGVQLGAEPGREAVLLAVSRQLEIAHPWHQRI